MSTPSRWSGTRPARDTPSPTSPHHEKFLHPRRAAGLDRDHRDSGGDAAACIKQGSRQSQSNVLPEQFQADRSGISFLRQ